MLWFFFLQKKRLELHIHQNCTPNIKTHLNTNNMFGEQNKISCLKNFSIKRQYPKLYFLVALNVREQLWENACRLLLSSMYELFRLLSFNPALAYISAKHQPFDLVSLGEPHCRRKLFFLSSWVIWCAMLYIGKCYVSGLRQPWIENRSFVHREVLAASIMSQYHSLIKLRSLGRVQKSGQ